jgi:hypothetical protein
MCNPPILGGSGCRNPPGIEGCRSRQPRCLDILRLWILEIASAPGVKQDVSRIDDIVRKGSRKDAMIQMPSFTRLGARNG